MRPRRLFRGSLATVLLWRTLLISIAPMLIIAIVALYAFNVLIHKRFADQAGYIASTVTGEIVTAATAASSNASLLSESPVTRTLTEAGDGAQLAAFLKPLKQQLGMDVLNVSDHQGTIIGAAQDFTPGKKLPVPLLNRASALAQQSWVILDEPAGLTLHAVTPIRNLADDPVGEMDVGILLDSSFLQTKKRESQAEIALSWNDRVTASTTGLGGARLASSGDVYAQPMHRLSRNMTIGGKDYLAIITVIESHADSPVTLSVFAPLGSIEATSRALWLLMSLVGLSLSVVVVILTWRMARAIVNPFSQLVLAALRVQRGDLSARVQPKAKHELRLLEVAFNTMIDSLGEREIERASHEAELLYRASHDSLTGLPNRNPLEQALNDAVAEAAPGKTSALLCLDLDQFKIVNDTRGHNSGDRVLVTLTDLVRSVMRREDMLARLGGDEFAVLLPGQSVEQATTLAERMRRVVDDYRFVESGQGFALSISVGVTSITGVEPASDVLGQADIACYAAKSEGRNRVAVYEPGAEAMALLAGDGRWTIDLKDALVDNRFRLVFQPVMQISSERIDHYETLIRLVDRDGGVIGPGAFIPAAERSGLIRDIDHWVLNAALDKMCEEAAQGNHLRLAINLSGVTFGSSESADFIREAIEVKRVDPSALIFEITETALMTNLGKVRATMEILGRMGCHFALDDFGSGFSSFTYLAQLPVDSVKIDGSFVHDLASNPVNQAMVRAMSNVTHSMGKQSIAEWVEDAETLAVLRRLHVDFAQGYYIGHPDGIGSQPPLVPTLNDAGAERPETHAARLRKIG